MASNEFYQISCPWRSQWFVFAPLIYYSGATASQIIQRLPELETLCRNDYPMSFAELSTVSKNLVSLTCLKGFAFDTAISILRFRVDLPLLILSRLEEVKFSSGNVSDLHFIIYALENSIPQCRGGLKKLILRHNPLVHIDRSSYDDKKFSTSLIKVIEVCISFSNL
jgi:hypothetical protein